MNNSIIGAGMNNCERKDEDKPFISTGWRQEYDKLCGFISENKQIEISGKSIKIPPSDKAAFWELFDAVRLSFLSGNFQPFLEQANTLKCDYQNAVTDLKKRLDVDLSQTSGKGGFLSDTENASIKTMFDPLFGLITGSISIETFEKKAYHELNAFFEAAIQSGFEQYVVLSLMHLLNANSLKASRKNETAYKQILGIQLSKNPDNKDFGKPTPVPELFQTNKIVYERPQADPLLTPDFIFYSKILKADVAVRFGYRESIFDAWTVSADREWLPVNSMNSLSSSTIFLYADSNPLNIALVADAKRICRPDLILECRGLNEWWKENELRQIKQNHETLKPNLGTYIISRFSLPEAAYNALAANAAPEDQEQGIHILSIDSDPSGLNPVIDALTQLTGVGNNYQANNSKPSNPFENCLKTIQNSVSKFFKSTFKVNH